MDRISKDHAARNWLGATVGLGLALVGWSVVVAQVWTSDSPALGLWWLLLPLGVGLILRWPHTGVPLLLAGMPLVPVGMEGVTVALAGLVVARTAWDMRLQGLDRLGTLGRISLLLLLAWLAWALVAALANPDPLSSLAAASRWLALALAGWSCGAWWGFGRRWIVVAAAVLFALACYAGIVFPWHSKASSIPFFLNTNDLSGAMVLTYPAMIAMIRVARRLRQMAYQTIVLGGMELVYAFHGRAVWLTVGLAALVFPLALFRRLPLRLLYGTLILAMAGWYFHWRVTHPTWKPTTTEAMSQLRSIGNLGGDFSNRERAMRWECARRMAIDRPVLGHGPGRFPEELPHYLRDRQEIERISYWFGWKHGAHNDALTLLAEIGVPGLGLWLAVMGLALVAALRRIRWGRGLRHPANVLAITLLMWCLLTCFNDTFEDARLLSWGFLLMGLAVRQRPHTPRSLTV